eukprot:2596769-Amphidinium_carterae.1
MRPAHNFDLFAWCDPHMSRSSTMDPLVSTLMLNLKDLRGQDLLIAALALSWSEHHAPLNLLMRSDATSVQARCESRQPGTILLFFDFEQ